MSMNLTKRKIFCIKGSATVTLPNYSFETTKVMKDLGILINGTLSWTQHAGKERRKLSSYSKRISQKQISRPEKTHISVTLYEL